MDINPFTKQLQIYNQTCTEMILDNTYCKGEWVDNPVATYNVDKASNQVTTSNGAQFSNCTVIDRKNWECLVTDTSEIIQAKNGKVILENKDQNSKRQITRLEWLQNKLLAKISQ